MGNRDLFRFSKEKQKGCFEARSPTLESDRLNRGILPEGAGVKIRCDAGQQCACPAINTSCVVACQRRGATRERRWKRGEWETSSGRRGKALPQEGGAPERCRVIDSGTSTDTDREGTSTGQDGLQTSHLFLRHENEQTNFRVNGQI